MFTPLDFEQTFMIEGQILGFCGPLFFSCCPELLPMNVVSNGTFGLVDTGQRKLLVTCSHVVADFDREKAENPDFQIAVLLGAGYPVGLARSQLIDSDSRLDLATFDMEPVLSHCSERRFYRLDEHPAPTLKPRDILAFIGYTGESRSLDPMGANFGYQSFGLSVADVSGFQIAADVSDTTLLSDREGQTLPPSRSHGGISGAPCFQLTRKNVLRLAAFATEEGLGLVRMTHASRIRADGTLAT
jgi:hypothetical protein